MTLILACATHDYVVQVSDRRLIWLVDNQVMDQDDYANKVVLFCRRMAFAYTGLAEINGKKTDEWLMDVLAASNSLPDACLAIESSATEAFRRISLPSSKKRHAFVGVGWTLLAPDEQLRAAICTISNAQGEQGGWLPKARDKFTLQYTVLPELKSHQLENVGQRLSEKKTAEIERQIKNCIEHKTGPKPIARLLVRAVREVAARKRQVGQDLLVVSLPRNAVPSGELILMNAPPNREEMTFLYVPAGENDGVQYGPVLVGCGPQFRDWHASSGLARFGIISSGKPIRVDAW
jgi:hypothetical protein